MFFAHHTGFSDKILNPTAAVAAFYVVVYILMEPLAGLLMTPLLVGLYMIAIQANVAVPAYVPSIFGFSQVICWTLQFLAHGFIEKRAPALLDNLFQAILTAPFFVFMEVLFHLGYRPQLKEDIDKDIQLKLEDFLSKKQ
mmetsp:Transcript_44286/g.115076  ORF Transcript_44286/g.115076 Transcript_44286/m.115076 type:complete len:140 (+) Transcript_44286:504-923(+)